MSISNKLIKVSEHITINRYDNGWMVEVSGRNYEDDWTTTKIVCNTESEVLDLFKEYNQLPIEN